MSKTESTSYQVFFTQTSYKHYQKLDSAVRKKVDKAIKRLKISPVQSNIERLIGHPEANYRYRIGNWRILFDMYPNQTIYILHIWPRGKDYKK